MNDLYYKDAQHLYLRIDGHYYKRVGGKGWTPTTQEAVPNPETWTALQDAQRETYLRVLKAAGVISE